MHTRPQASGFNASLVSDAAIGVDVGTAASRAAGVPLVVRLNTSGPAGRARLHTRALIVALGAESKWLGVPGEHEHRGGGVSSCATCDGFLFRDQPVLVVGGGDSAMEEALVLARTSSHVTLVARGPKLRASHALAARVLEHPKIAVRYHTTVERFDGDGGRLTHALLRTPAADGAESTSAKLAVGAAFIAIGHAPNTALLQGAVQLRDDGYIDMGASGRSSRTSRAGIFAAGDVADPVYRQAITSAGSGAMAALDAERWLSEGGGGAAGVL